MITALESIEFTTVSQQGNPVRQVDRHIVNRNLKSRSRMRLFVFLWDRFDFISF